MKAVPDTNVLVSGIFFSGPPFTILRAWNQGKYRLVLTPEILTECREVASRFRARFPAIDIDRFLDLVVVESEMCAPVTLARAVCTDPNGDKFVAAAIGGGADVIVRGDKHWLQVSGYHGIAILKPRQFVERYLRS